MDTASSQSGELTLPAISAPRRLPGNTGRRSRHPLIALPLELIQDLWLASTAESCGVARDELAAALEAIGAKNNHGLPMEPHPNATQKAAFFAHQRFDAGYGCGNPNINHD